MIRYFITRQTSILIQSGKLAHFLRTPTKSISFLAISWGLSLKQEFWRWFYNFFFSILHIVRYFFAKETMSTNKRKRSYFYLRKMISLLNVQNNFVSLLLWRKHFNLFGFGLFRVIFEIYQVNSRKHQGCQVYICHLKTIVQLSKCLTILATLWKLSLFPIFRKKKSLFI